MWANPPCDRCETESDERVVEQLPWPGPHGVVYFRHVKAKVCRSCGQVWVTAQVARRLDEALAQQPEPVGTVMEEAPVFAAP